jgi:putative ABC transport system permease protein
LISKPNESWHFFGGWFGMFQNYFRTAWRSLLRNRLYSTLNVLGLAIGMAVALLIGLWVHQQYSYDRFLPGYQQAYQVKYNYINNGEVRTTSNVCIPLAEALKKDIPEVTHTAMAFGPGLAATFRNPEKPDKRISLQGLNAGEEFLQIMQYPVLEGNAATALKDPASVVLTETAARALFGNDDPIGKTLVEWGSDAVKVTAVIKDIPRESTLQFGFISPFSAFASGGWVKAAVTNWGHTFFTMYASLNPNAGYDKVAPKIATLVKKYAPDTYRTFQQQVIMQPLKDWHLYTDYKNGQATGGLIDYLRMFSIIGVLVLLIACINFMNLSTARSAKRAKEVGIRKVAGSSRRALITQFLVESVFITFVAFLLSLVIVQLVLPAFNALARTDIHLPLDNPAFWMIMGSYVLMTGLLAGSRPAFYLSAFQPVKVLKGTMRIGPSASIGRKALVILQFTCSVGLIISTITIFQQIEHARTRPKGYDPNRLLYSGATGGDNYPALKNELLATGLVSGVTLSLSPATGIYSHNTIDGWPGSMPGEGVSLAMNAVGDANYFRTLDIPLVEGSNFSGNLAVDTLNVILNEAAVKRMRLQHPINQYITWHLSDAPNRLRIIGVAGDAVTNGPFSPAEPTVFVYQPTWVYTIMWRLNPRVNTHAALAQLKPVFDKYNPNAPFEYHFVDDSYAASFELETMIGKLAGIFAALAIIISCLGLFGLAAYVAEQRTKEIGIRKVLGATVPQIFLMLTGDFLLMVGISCIIASPVAFYFLYRWLQQYSYRITIDPIVFVLAALVTLLITAATISVQAIRAAGANPATSLRSE